MPTAIEYDVWADGLGGRADELTGLAGPLVEAASPEVLIGGSLAVTVDVAVRAAAENTLASAGQLRELAEECRQRAEVCRQYEVAMALYERQRDAYSVAIVEYGKAVTAAEASGGVVGSPPRAPTQPDKPHPWVER